MTREAYGAWPSPIDAALVAGARTGFGNLRAAGDALFWLESRPNEGAHATLVRHCRGTRRDLVPKGFDARSRVYEYGGGAFCVGSTHAYFVNNRDQNIYAVALEPGADDSSRAMPTAITNSDSGERFGDLWWDGKTILAVRERHRASAEPVHDLVRVRVESGQVETLHQGRDFYAAPRPSADGRLAFLVWDHPNMPWDGTELVVAGYGDSGLRDATVVAGGATESIAQPQWCDARLLFASDANGYWNLHAYDDAGVRPIAPDTAEHAGPAWQLGDSHYAVTDRGHAVARRVQDGIPSLVVVDLERGCISPLHDARASYSSIVATPGGVAFVAGAANAPPQIVELDLRSRQLTTIAAGGALNVPASVLSEAEPIAFRTPTGEAHAFFYPPRNGERKGLADELPPLLVTTHGGPTSSASADLSWRAQFYTSRGWAVVDVNYGGSTGYGRAYRERLRGAWGVVDVQDCVACVRHLVAAGRADPNRVAIRGGSAGGYTTLAALTFTDVFKAGASHYGIGDLAALDRDTHKFESRYVGTLTGGGDAVRERSPINHVDQLRCPVIFLQGADDKIVPPSQAEAMRDALAAKGVPVEYLLFEGEGHGFRRAENIRRAIDAEHDFFRRAFALGRGSPEAA